MKSTRVHIFSFFLLLVFGCEKEKLDKFTFPTFKVEDVQLSVKSSDPLEAGGGSVEMFLILGSSVPVASTVALKIQGVGRFSNNEDTFSLTVGPDEMHVFQVRSQHVGSAIVSAEISNLKVTKEITFMKASSAFSLIASPQRILLNGELEIEIVARITNPDLFQQYDSIQFLTSRGLFANEKTMIWLPVSADSTAIAHLRYTQPGTAVVSAALGIYTRTIEAQFVPVLESFSISVLNNDMPADNNSESAIRVLLYSANIANQSVRFKVTKGTFSDGSSDMMVDVLTDSTATAHLKHKINENVTVTATVLGQSRQAVVSFVRAWPESIIVEPKQHIITNTPGAYIDLTAQLLRTSGTVTQGTHVTWIDSTESGVSPGIFLSSSISDELGMVKTQYHLQDTTFEGRSYIVAKVQTPTGVVTGFNRIVVNKD